MNPKEDLNANITASIHQDYLRGNPAVKGIQQYIKDALDAKDAAHDSSMSLLTAERDAEIKRARDAEAELKQLRKTEQSILDLSHPNIANLMKEFAALKASIPNPSYSQGEVDRMMGALKAENVDLKRTLKTAHEIFGSESDKLGAEILRLAAENEELRESVRHCDRTHQIPQLKKAMEGSSVAEQSPYKAPVSGSIPDLPTQAPSNGDNCAQTPAALTDEVISLLTESSGLMKLLDREGKHEAVDDYLEKVKLFLKRVGTSGK